MTENTTPETETAVSLTKAPTTETVHFDGRCECSRWAATVGFGDEREIHDAIRCYQTTTRTFAPGHDAKLKGYLIRWGARELDILDAKSGETWSAQFVANQYGFGHMVAAGIAKAQAKAAERQAKADAKHEAKAAKAKPAATPVNLTREGRKATSAFRPYPEATPEAEPLPVPVPAKAKVGRWTYEGTVNVDGTFTYNAKLGGTKTAEAGTFTVLDA